MPAAERVESISALVSEFLVIDPLGIGPNDRTPREEWLARFRATGFFVHTSELVPVDGGHHRREHIDRTDSRPAENITLFRCCPPGAERRLSWAATITNAADYGHRGKFGFFNPKHCRIYFAEVPREHILAVFRQVGSRGSEYIVDTEGLNIIQLGSLS